MTNDDIMTRLGHSGGDLLWGSRFYSGAMKGCFDTHISTFSILNSEYTHIQGFIFVRRRRRLALRVAILFWRYKGGFYTHISTFSILNSAYTHIQAFIFMRRRRGLAIRVTVLFWHYERFGFLRIYHLFHTKQHIYFQGASGYNQGVVKGNSLS